MPTVCAVGFYLCLAAEKPIFPFLSQPTLPVFAHPGGAFFLPFYASEAKIRGAKSTFRRSEAQIKGAKHRIYNTKASYL